MNKLKQEYSNHRQVVPSFHYLMGIAVLVLLSGSVFYLFNRENSYVLPFLVNLIVLTMINVAFHTRSFAIKVQDRAIRAEESLRYFILTGKRLNQDLSIKQIVALRFASDEEFVALVALAYEQKLKPDEIKRLIKKWQPDYYRA